MSDNLKTWPERIYLAYPFNDDDPPTSRATACTIGDDIEYIRADLVKQLEHPCPLCEGHGTAPTWVEKFSVVDERTLFEQAYREIASVGDHVFDRAPQDYSREYVNALVDRAWGAWQARAALSAQTAQVSEQEPVAWFEYAPQSDSWFLTYSYNPNAKTKPLYEHPEVQTVPIIEPDRWKVNDAEANTIRDIAMEAMQPVQDTVLPPFHELPMNFLIHGWERTISWPEHLVKQYAREYALAAIAAYKEHQK